jgi:CRP/FNR family transcriptional regulator, cyclic AMP receptor protein
MKAQQGMTQVDHAQLKILASVGWLSGESAEFRARVSAIGRWISLSRGESVYEAGDEPMAIYGLGEGLLDVLVPLGEDEEVLIHRAPPGFWIGDGTILTGAKRAVSVRTARDSRLFAVPGGAPKQQLSLFPEGWVALQRLSARNAQLAVTALAEVLALPPLRLAPAALRITRWCGSSHLGGTGPADGHEPHGQGLGSSVSSASDLSPSSVHTD